MFSVNSTSSAPHIYQGSYPSYPIYHQLPGLNWSHGQSFGGDHRSYSPYPSHNQLNSFQQQNAMASFTNPSPVTWSYVPQTAIRSIPPPSPNVYSSYSLGPVNPSPLYSSHSSVNGGNELGKSDLYSSSSSLNNGSVHVSTLTGTGDQSGSLTHSASFPKQEPAKKPSSRIHDTPAAAGLRNAVLNSDQAQEYFRMKQTGILQYSGARNLKGTQEPAPSALQKQSNSETARSPTKISLPNSGAPSPWAKSPPGISNSSGISPSKQAKQTSSQTDEVSQASAHPPTEKSLPAQQGGSTISASNLQFSHLEYRESPSTYRDSLPFGVQKRADMHTAVRIADSEIGYLC